MGGKVRQHLEGPPEPRAQLGVAMGARVLCPAQMGIARVR